MAERLGLGYAVAGAIVGALIVLTAVLWRAGMNPVLGFWIVYIFTRPLGASIGDYLSQSRANGGLGLGTTKTSFVFLAAILAVVVFLTITKVDTSRSNHFGESVSPKRGGLWQTALYTSALVVGGSVLYNVRTHSLSNEAGSAASAPATKLGDLGAFRLISQDTLDKLNADDQSGATKRISDLEAAWDKSQARLQPLDGKSWTQIDGKVDTVLRKLRATSPDVAAEKLALADLLAVLV